MLDHKLSVEEPQHVQNEANSDCLGLERYQVLQKIGEGAYGLVYRGIDTVTQKQVAIKKVKIEDDESEGIPQSSLREISFLKALQNLPNIVNLNEVVYKLNEKKLFLIFEYLDWDLKNYMQKNQISSHQIKLIMYQILNGLNSCHQRRIMHRDLKSQNVLIDKEGNVKIADFGLSKTFSVPPKTLSHEVETLWYRAPEILLGLKSYSLGIDIWSVGCIFFELVERRPMFQSDSEIDAIFQIFQFHGTPNEENFPGLNEYPHFSSKFPRFKAQDPTRLFTNMKDDALDLFMQMIALNPLDRITVKEALLHPYFESLTELEKQVYNQDNQFQEQNFFSS